jgi:hypothetical protein
MTFVIADTIANELYHQNDISFTPRQNEIFNYYYIERKAGLSFILSTYTL